MRPPWVIDLPGLGCELLRVDRRDDALRAVAAGGLLEEARIPDAGRVDADLVGARIEQRADVVDRIHATAHGKGNEHLVGDRFDHVVEQSARLDAGTDVEEGELVGTLLVVAPGDLHRIAGVAQVHEVHALDHASRGHVETRDDALGEAHRVVCAAEK